MGKPIQFMQVVSFFETSLLRYST